MTCCQMAKAELRDLGYPTKGLDPLAAKPMFRALRSNPKKLGLMAQDTAATKRYSDKFPGVGKLKIR
jgi:hypothetical protein